MKVENCLISILEKGIDFCKKVGLYMIISDTMFFAGNLSK
jgi:hypothetical protein